MDWRHHLKHDPIAPLLDSGNPAIAYFTNKDLLDKPVGPVESLWELPEPVRILGKQQADGAWRYPAGNSRIRDQRSYNQVETFRNLSILVEKYGMTRRHPQVAKAAEFLFSCQTPQGDFRGILGHQYAPYYSAAFMEEMIKAGYPDDPRIHKGFEWLLTMRQDDGGWAMPMRTRKANLDIISRDVPAPGFLPNRHTPNAW